MHSVATWNLARGLSDGRSARRIISHIEELDADTYIMSNALEPGGGPAYPSFAEHLGYQSLTIPYEDTYPQSTGERWLVAMSRTADCMTPVRLGTRNAVSFFVENFGQIIGTHLDSRQESSRLAMTQAINYEAGPPDNPISTVIAGDLRAMYSGDPWVTLSAMIDDPLVGTSRVLSWRSMEPIEREGPSLADVARRQATAFLREHGLTYTDPGIVLGRFAIAQRGRTLHTPDLRCITDVEYNHPKPYSAIVTTFEPYQDRRLI